MLTGLGASPPLDKQQNGKLIMFLMLIAAQRPQLRHTPFDELLQLDLCFHSQRPDEEFQWGHSKITRRLQYIRFVTICWLCNSKPRNDGHDWRSKL
jgi:hypothetical protein